jgi:hypothetical protein
MPKLKTLLVSLTMTFIALLPLGACTGADHRASYSNKAQGVTIAIELFTTHPFLAEYDRVLVLSSHGKDIARQKLFPDTGGYSSSNLYRCGPTKYMLKGYFDVWVIDITSGTITEGKCKDGSSEYVGIFYGGGSKQWRFYSSSEHKEEKLEPQGG